MGQPSYMKHIAAFINDSRSGFHRVDSNLWQRQPGVWHDLNLYPQCTGWRFMVRCYGKPQSLETSLSGKKINFAVSTVLE